MVAHRQMYLSSEFIQIVRVVARFIRLASSLRGVGDLSLGEPAIGH